MHWEGKNKENAGIFQRGVPSHVNVCWNSGVFTPGENPKFVRIAALTVQKMELAQVHEPRQPVSVEWHWGTGLLVIIIS